MTLALKWCNYSDQDAYSGGFIYFDAVTSFTQNHRGQVTKHPVDGGGRITDHFIRENSTYNISAVLSAVDVSNATFVIQDLEGNTPFNVEMVTQPVFINQGGLLNGLKKFIPSSIDQFIPDTEPEIIMQDARGDYLTYIRSLFTKLLTGKIFNPETNQYDSHIEVVSLYEYDNLVLKSIVTDLVLVGISIREDINTGGGLFCDFSLEKVEFVSLQKTTIPQNITDSLNAQSASKVSKGKQDSTVGTAGDEDSPKTDVDPLRKVVSEL
jgi:hypothetical protein